MRSERFWPLWIAGLQLTTIFGHLMKASTPTCSAVGLWRGARLLELSDRPHPRDRDVAQPPPRSAQRDFASRLRLRSPVAAANEAQHVPAQEIASGPWHAHRPRLWGKHAVAAALDNPERQVLKAWATREARRSMQFPKEVAVTFADVADLGRLVPHDAPHQGLVIEVEPLEDVWLDGLLQRRTRARRAARAGPGHRSS